MLGRNLKQQLISSILQPSESFKRLQTEYIKEKTEEDMQKRLAKMELHQQNLRDADKARSPLHLKKTKAKVAVMAPDQLALIEEFNKINVDREVLKKRVTSKVRTIDSPNDPNRNSNTKISSMILALNNQKNKDVKHTASPADKH